MECPACGGPVTLEVGPDRPPSASVVDAVLAADTDEPIVIDRTCWNCGWQETRHVRVDSIKTTAGDAAAIERARLLDEITEELDGIDRLATLEDVLAAVRRQRRLELTSDEEEADGSE